MSLCAYSLLITYTTPPIKDRIYYVSGAASGLGYATAADLVKRGAKVALLDINEEAGQKAVRQLGSNAFFCECDVTNESDIDKAIAATEKHWSGVKTAGVVNAGGVAWVEAVVNANGDPASIDAFKRIMEINVVGTYSLSQKVASRIVKQYPKPKKPVNFGQLLKEGKSIPDYVPDAVQDDRGIIVLVSSASFQDGQNGQTAYASSKGAVASMALPMARDLSRYGIRVVAIAPSLFSTSMGSKTPDKARARLLQDTLFPARFGAADEFSAFVIATIENAMLNATTIRLDGGTRFSKI